MIKSKLNWGLVFFLSSFLLFSSFSINQIQAQLYDAKVLCSQSGCSGFYDSIFNETNMLPGHQVTKVIEVENTRNETISAKLNGVVKSKTSSRFLKQIIVTVHEVGGPNKYSNTLNHFLTKSDIDLGKIGKTSKQYAISMLFNSQAGNEYKNNQVVFTLELHLTGEDGKEIKIEDNDQKSKTANSKPTTSTTNAQDTSAVTSESGEDDQTGIVAGISAIVDRLFSPVIINPNPPERLEDTTTPDQQGQVAGITTHFCPFWWIVLIAQSILLLLLSYKTQQFKNKTRKRWLTAASLVLLGFLVDHYAHTHWFTPSQMCKYTPIILTLSAIGEIKAFDWVRKRNQ